MLFVILRSNIRLARSNMLLFNVSFLFNSCGPCIDMVIDRSVKEKDEFGTLKTKIK